MSSVPPPDAAILPWERRRGLDPFRAFIETVKLFVARPDEAWRITPERAGFESPLLFGLIVSFIGAVISFLYRWIFVSPWIRMFPSAMVQRWGGRAWMGARPRGCALIFWPFGAAIGILIGLFIVAAIIHLFVLIVGAARTSASGFEGTFRTICYASVASLAQIIPLVGGLIALVWWIVLAGKGIQRMHRTTVGKAYAAVLLPIAVMVGLVVLVVVLVVGVLLATGHHTSYTL